MAAMVLSSMTRTRVTAVATAGMLTVALAAQEPDHATLASIRDEGLRGSQAMDHISWLSDVYGPRVTGTPAIEQARVWTMEKLREWDLSDVHELKRARNSVGQAGPLGRFLIRGETGHDFVDECRPLLTIV